MLPFSRKLELEADHIGYAHTILFNTCSPFSYPFRSLIPIWFCFRMMLMTKAGYDPNDMVHLFERFGQAKLQSGGNPQQATPQALLQYLGTHPTDAKRVRHTK